MNARPRDRERRRATEAPIPYSFVDALAAVGCKGRGGRNVRDVASLAQPCRPAGRGSRCDDRCGFGEISRRP